MSRQAVLRAWLLLLAGFGLLLAAVFWRPPLHRELIVFGVAALMLAGSSFLEPWGQPKPPPPDV